MAVAGIGWSGDGYECVVGGSRTRFPTGGLADLIAHLAGLGARVVVDSTNGLVDGSLMVAGLDVYRVDAADLPPRPAFGSVDAAVLAGCDPARLTRLAIATGTIAGRGDDTEAALAASAEAERRLAALGRFAEHGTRDRADLALTFDDGPDPRYTPAILDILRDHEVPATFFCVGMNAAGYPQLVERAATEGHVIGNHTWSHPYLPELAGDEVRRQAETTGRAVAAATGAPPVLVRPPYGARSPQVVAALADLGLTTVLWDVDPADWSRPGTEAIVTGTLTAARPGSVVLMHDGGGDRSQTVAALPAVIAGLRARGYRLVTLDRLL